MFPKPSVKTLLELIDNYTTNKTPKTLPQGKRMLALINIIAAETLVEAERKLAA